MFGPGAEDRELEALVLGDLEVIPVVDQHEGRADHGADELTGQVHGDLVPRGGPVDGEADGDGRVQVRAADRASDDDAHEHGECPCRGDDDPAGVVGLGLREQDAGDDAVAEQDQEHRADRLGDEDV